jgi:hypothetical protein
MANKEQLLLSREQELYLVWLLTPEDQRDPKTKKAWAEQNNVHQNTLGAWEKKKNFVERWKMGVEGLNQSPERTQKLLDALYIKGVAGDTKSAELYLKATGSMPNATSTLNIKNETSVRDLSDEDLESLILELGTKHTKKTKAEIAAVFPDIVEITRGN